MWFKNLRLFRLTAPFTLTPEALEERLAAHPARPASALEPATFGFVPPLGRSATALVHVVEGWVMVCARREDKVLPASVVRELVDEKVSEIEAEQLRSVGRREREAIRDELTLDLLRQAFSRASLTYAYISTRDGWLVVDAASPKKAEELVSRLRDALETLPVAPPAVAQAPASVMTRWLGGRDLPAHFALGDECELRDPQAEGSLVRCKHLDLTGAEIAAHLKAGKQAIRLGIEWNEVLTCVLEEDLGVKRLRFSEMVHEQAGEVGSDEEAARFDADFALMALELSRFIPALLEAFGGEDQSAYGRTGAAA